MDGKDERGEQLKQQIDDALDRLSGQLAEGHTDEYLALLKYWSGFHSYSLGNTILIWLQRPEASVVAGYQAWKARGRQVKKGTKAIWILCPLIGKVDDPDTGEKVEVIRGFRGCHVFADTDLEPNGEPIPTMWKPLPDDCSDIYWSVESILIAQGLKISYKPMAVSQQGYAMPDADVIVIKEGLDSRNRLLVLLHEACHAIVHKWKDAAELSKEQKELEAESVAFVLASIFGVEHPTARDYVLMQGGKPEILKAAVPRIQAILREMTKVLLPALEPLANAA